MPNRRTFLASAAAVTLAKVAPATADVPFVVRESDPPNLEATPTALAAPVTANDAFFVRCHFPVPKIDLKQWRLTVEGRVERPLSLSFDELKSLPKVTRPATIECAGNGRVLLVPKVRGVAWHQGGVSHAEWSGISLASVLEKAGVHGNAVDVVLEGSDQGAINDDPKSPGPISFARSVPLKKAMAPETLLAWQMNGKEITPEHGAPLRAVVGGWYGMASVKWLRRIVVVDHAYQGFWQTMDYSFFDRKDGLPGVVPITAMQVKSIVLTPQPREVLPAGIPIKVTGRAWAGEKAVAKVETSIDGGATWQPATLTEQTQAFAWTAWETTISNPTPGRMAILVRATDVAGNVQPMTRSADRRTYMVNHVVPVEVVVR